MISSTFTITGELVSLNEYIDIERRHYHLAASIKKKETKRVAQEIMVARLKPLKKFPIHITYTWYSKDSRKDIDNVSFSKKFIQDGMVLAGIIPDDSRKYITAFTESFHIDKKNPRVEITITVVD